ncbi:hypothetical protein BDV93DRAFT_515415 [Ceratobasidium sp. AG-I]|nr:hypothetical protein BDV93DRAFT_515415 [Ceratobasidium sp. AG-I]
MYTQGFIISSANSLTPACESPPEAYILCRKRKFRAKNPIQTKRCPIICPATSSLCPTLTTFHVGFGVFFGQRSPGWLQTPPDHAACWDATNGRRGCGYATGRTGDESGVSLLSTPRAFSVGSASVQHSLLENISLPGANEHQPNPNLALAHISTQNTAHQSSLHTLSTTPSTSSNGTPINVIYKGGHAMVGAGWQADGGGWGGENGHRVLGLEMTEGEVVGREVGSPEVGTGPTTTVETASAGTLSFSGRVCGGAASVPRRVPCLV